MNSLTRSFLFLLTFSLLVFTTACSDDDNKSDTILKEAVNNKWVISNSTLKSIELNNSGNYIITGSLDATRASADDDVISFGNYIIVDEVNNIIELKEAKMRMKIVTYKNDSINFILTLLDTNKEYTFDATKGKEIASSSKTDLLCQTWVITKYETTEPNVNNDYDECDDLVGTTILFSKAGTYYVANPKCPESGGIANWGWLAGSNETKIFYFWEDDDEPSDVTINELSKDTLVMTETFEDERIPYSDIYTLVPYTAADNGVKTLNQRSTRLKTRKASGILGNR